MVSTCELFDSMKYERLDNFLLADHAMSFSIRAVLHGVSFKVIGEGLILHITLIVMEGSIIPWLSEYQTIV